MLRLFLPSFNGFAFGDYFGIDFSFKSALFDSSKFAGEVSDVVGWDDEATDAEDGVCFVVRVGTGDVGAVVPEFVEVSDVHFSS